MAVRTRAADDFHCSARQISLEQIRPYRQSQAYLAQGCGQRQAYEGACQGKDCVVEPIPSAVPWLPLNAAAPVATVTASGQPPGSIVLKTMCPRTVKLFHGDKPKASGGIESQIGPNEARGFDSTLSRTIWILDDNGEGVASATIGSGEQRLHITPECRAFAPD